MRNLTKVLITGSEGFIGRSLRNFLALNSPNYDIYTLDKTGSGEKHLKVDLKNRIQSESILDISPEIIVHLAGNVSVSSSLKYPLEDLESNTFGTLNLLLAADKSNYRNFVYVTSGGAIYDTFSEKSLSEDSPIKPISPYGLSKFASEGYVRVLSEIRKSNWTSLALSNCYGPVTQQTQGVIYEIWKNLQSGERPVIYGTETSRDFIYIDDVVEALSLAMANPVNRRVNISSNTSVTLGYLYQEILSILMMQVEPVIRDVKIGHIEQSKLENTLAKELLGWYPKIDIRTGLRRCFTEV
jgi:UDP-glucose 4-epimerase